MRVELPGAVTLAEEIMRCVSLLVRHSTDRAHVPRHSLALLLLCAPASSAHLEVADALAMPSDACMALAASHKYGYWRVFVCTRIQTILLI